jgi:hypothetical protein
MFVEELAAKLGLEVDLASFEKGFEAIEGLKLGMGGLVGIAVAAAGALAAMTRNVAMNAVEISKGAQRAGITTDAYQEMAFAAEQSGLSAEEMEHGMRHLSHTMMEAATGSGDAAYTVRQLGISMYDAHGKAKSTDQVLEDVAERISKMPDGWRKTALAQQAFGRAGSELIPLLNKGKGGLEQLRQAAHDYGIVLDDETIAAGKRWNEQQKALKAALIGVKNAIGSGLLKQVGDLTGKIAEWIRVNRELIAGDVLTFVRKTKEVIGDLWSVINAVFVQTGAWKAMLIALGIAIALLNAPLIALIAAILLFDDVLNFVDGKKHTFLETLFPADKVETIRAFMQDVRDFVKWMLGGGIGDALADLTGKGQASGNGMEKLLGFFGMHRGGAFEQGGMFAGNVQGGPDMNGTGVFPYAAPNATAPAGNTSVAHGPISLTINAPQGVDAQNLADLTIDGLVDAQQRQLRETAAAVNH